jgi:hypothetical protein
MINEINQVQIAKLPKRHRELTITELWLATYLRKDVPESLTLLSNGKRRYPGELEAVYLLFYISTLPPRKREAFLKLLHPPVESNAAMVNIEKQIKGGNWACNFAKEGLVLLPTTNEGVASLGIFLLQAKGLLKRLRNCRNCGTLFFARSKRQAYCRDRNKKCQWNHYHSPQWRKKNRKRNRAYYKKYRKANF